ncbi:MAG: hypothetical protein AAFO07_04305 [Bacteroidota bacterium]
MTKHSILKTTFLLLILISFSGCNSPKNEDQGLSGFELELKGQIKNIPSTEIDQSPWGIHFNGMPFHDLTFAQYDSLDVDKLLEELPILIQKSNELGLKWARISVDWGLIEDNKGVFHWELLDPMINGLVDSGIEV